MELPAWNFQGTGDKTNTMNRKLLPNWESQFIMSRASTFTLCIAGPKARSLFLFKHHLARRQDPTVPTKPIAARGIPFEHTSAAPAQVPPIQTSGSNKTKLCKTNMQQHSIQYSAVPLAAPPSEAASRKPASLELEPPKAPRETPLEVELLAPLLKVEAPGVAPRPSLPLRLVHILPSIVPRPLLLVAQDLDCRQRQNEGKEVESTHCITEVPLCAGTEADGAPPAYGCHLLFSPRDMPVGSFAYAFYYAFPLPSCH